MHCLYPGPVVDLVFIKESKTIHPDHSLWVGGKRDKVTMADRVVKCLQFECGVTVSKLGPKMACINILKYAQKNVMVI